jgi:rare lipoprotein A
MVLRKYLAKLLFSFVLISPFSQTQASIPEDVQFGLASFYADRFHGRRTASGERYNKNDLTTVHAHYPFGTVLRVTNINNQRSVELRVNDRTRLPRGRLLDVSKRAASELGFIAAGVARVKVQVLRFGASRRNG